MDLAASTVAVTGATGFIGRYLVRALQGRGARVVAVVRDPAKMRSAADVRASALEIRQADLSDRSALIRAFSGCDAVMSNAGLVSIGAKSRAQLMEANARGTSNVFTAMAEAGVQRAVMTSSATVYARQLNHVYVEGDPLWTRETWVPRPLYYSVSKAVAEREAWRLAGEHDIDLSVARPSGVFGANDNTGFTKWLRRLMKVPLVSVFPTYFYVPNVYAGDLAEAMMRMLERPQACGKAYNVIGDNDISYWDMLEAYRQAGGEAPRVVVPFPFPVRFRYSQRRAESDLGFEIRDLVDAFTETLSLS